MILFVGRIADSRKGVSVLLDALERLWRKKGTPLFEAWLVGGSGPEIAALGERLQKVPVLRNSHQLGRLKLWGRVENHALPEFYSRARVTVVPSLREEFGLVAIEAQACGCPVVASRVGGLQDVLLESASGALVSPGDPSVLADATLEYIRDPELSVRQGQLARAWVSERFSWEVVIDQYVDLYEGK